MLPASFAKDGFFPLSKTKPKHKHLLIGTDGLPNTGKSEFALSAPGPGIFICIDRGYEAVLDNPNPPPARHYEDFAFKIIEIPLATQAAQPVYLDYWRNFYAEYKKALDNPDARTVVLDGDSDSWELQRLAEFGKLTQVPPIMYANVNAARRAMIARAFDSGKIVISTCKLKDGYESKMSSDNKEVRIKTGRFERQGFPDQEYLYQLQIRHLYNEETGKFGLRILRCKSDTTLQGMELWNGDCNFEALVQSVYPNVPLSEWGF
jgi:hypothetical protein